MSRVSKSSEGSGKTIDVQTKPSLSDVKKWTDDYRDGVEKTLAYLKKAGVIKNFSVKKEHAVVQQDDAEIGLMIPFE